MKTLKTTLFTLIITFILGISSTLAQAPDVEWQKSLGGSGEDTAHSLQQTADGGYIIAGSSVSNNGDVTGNRGNEDYWVVKLNTMGDIQWQKSLGGTGSDRANSIQQTEDGGYIVAGGSSSNNGDVTGNHGGLDYWIVKLNTTGDIQWQKSLGGSDFDTALSIQQTNDNSYIVAGITNSNNGDVTENKGIRDYWIVKLSTEGDLAWQRSFGGSDDDRAHSIQQTSDGGYIIAGLSISSDGDITGNQGNGDCWIVKLNEAGNMEWQKSLGGSSTDIAYSIQQTPDNGYIISGFSTSNDGDVTENQGGLDCWIAKLNSMGTIQWQKSLGGSDDELFSSIQQTSDGGYIAGGRSNSTDGDVSGNHGAADYWIIKLNPDPLSLNEFALQIMLYPNPVSTVLTIAANEPVKSVAVFNSLGKEVMASSHFETVIKLDVSGLLPSMYFVVVTTEKSREIFKITVR